MKRILLVDDVGGWLRFHKNNLCAIGISQDNIEFALSAREGVSKIEANIDTPYDVIFTDLQMESDFLPKYAGEWFVEQIKTYKEYNNTKIVIISASPTISRIAERLGVSYFPKTVARNSSAQTYEQYI